MRKTGIKATKNNIILTFSMEKQRKNPKPIKFTDSELNFIIQKAKEKIQILQIIAKKRFCMNTS